MLATSKLILAGSLAACILTLLTGTSALATPGDQVWSKTFGDAKAQVATGVVVDGSGSALSPAVSMDR